MNQNPFQDQPRAPKSHFNLNKFRKISSIDREIRKKWSKLDRQKLEQERDNFHQIINLQKYNRIQAANLQNQSVFENPLKINKVRSEIIREQTHLRKQNYDNIYFRKHKKKTKLNLSPPLKSLKVHPSSRAKTEFKDERSLLLRKRSCKMEREFKVIQNSYDQNLKLIKQKTKNNEMKVFDEQKSWLKKIKDKKCYFRLISPWQPPQ